MSAPGYFHRSPRGEGPKEGRISRADSAPLGGRWLLLVAGDVFPRPGPRFTLNDLRDLLGACHVRVDAQYYRMQWLTI